MRRVFLSRKWLLAIFVLPPLWIYAFYHAVTTNPTDSDEKLARMRTDVDRLLAIGGNVIERKENAKYGGAYIALVMDEAGWSAELMKKYEGALLEGGWVRKPELNAYCSAGMKIEIRRHAGMRDQSAVNYIGATYDAQTLRDCRL